MPLPSERTAALPAELIGQLKAIQIRTQRLVTDALAGDYESAFKGRGLEFEEVREYQAGDDIRHIDWNVTARCGQPHVKEHREERELTVMLLVDVSSSGAFGSGGKFKNEVAAEVAAILAYTAVKSNDRVGLTIFSDRIEHFIPPKKGRAHVWRVIRDILSFRPEHRGTDLSAALRHLGKVVRRRAVVFLISDFVDTDVQRGGELRILSKRHDITVIRVSDPREEELPAIGLLELEDAETGELVLVDTADERVRKAFYITGVQDRRQHDDYLRRAGIDDIAVRTDSSYVDPIVRFFRRRGNR